MALFSGKIIDAHYTDPEYSVVEVLYEGDDGKLYSHALIANSENQDWIDLIADGWDQDKLIDGTAEYKRSMSASFNTQVSDLASKMVSEMVGLKTNPVQTGNEIFNFVLNLNKDKEELFKFKIWALELDEMKLASKEQKSEIRKAKSIIEGFWILNSINELPEP